jgi:hypothetical protein
MANPNIVNVSNILGGTTVAHLTTSMVAQITNAAASGKIIKVNTVIAAETTGIDAYDVTISVYRSSADYYIADAVTVPPAATLVIVDKNAPIYLMEGDSLRAKSSAASSIDLICSYEDIS